MKIIKKKFFKLLKSSKFNSKKRDTNKYFLTGLLYLTTFKISILSLYNNRKVRAKSYKKWILSKYDL